MTVRNYYCTRQTKKKKRDFEVLKSMAFFGGVFGMGFILLMCMPL